MVPHCQDGFLMEILIKSYSQEPFAQGWGSQVKGRSLMWLRGMKIQTDVTEGSEGDLEERRPGAGAPGLMEIVSSTDEWGEGRRRYLCRQDDWMQLWRRTLCPLQLRASCKVPAWSPTQGPAQDLQGAFPWACPELCVLVHLHRATTKGNDSSLLINI